MYVARGEEGGEIRSRSCAIAGVKLGREPEPTRRRLPVTEPTPRLRSRAARSTLR